MIERIPCPMAYIDYKKTNPQQFVNYCKSFVETNYRGMKCVGVKTEDDGTCYILLIPDYDAKRPVVKGTGKNRTVTYEPMYSVPIESFLNEEDIKFLESRGMDKYGNKFKKSE